MVLLFLAMACGVGFPVGPEGEEYGACVEQYRLACECEDPLVAGNGTDDPTWACSLSDQDVATLCGWADRRVCDPDDALFDASSCELWHSKFPDSSVSESMICYTQKVSDCDWQAAYDECWG